MEDTANSHDRIGKQYLLLQEKKNDASFLSERGFIRIKGLEAMTGPQNGWEEH